MAEETPDKEPVKTVKKAVKKATPVRRSRVKKETGEGDTDSFGRGKAGTASGMARRARSKKTLAPARLKEVMANWRHLDMTEVVEALADFFSDWPMRASANLAVAWERTKTNAKSFAIVNWAISFGENAWKELRLVRERAVSSGTRGLKRKTTLNKPKIGMGMKPGGPSGVGQ
ncbi:MAG: hypothetical protein PHS57_04610 [Alphaproteobacteria bacterium]|nr:hypothetical protein [Alphaproteobacteria bacterium]